MNSQLFLWSTCLVLCAGLTSNSNAATYEYRGTIETATGAFIPLTPPGSDVVLVYVVDDDAVASGIVGPSDIDSINFSLGLFCFSSESTDNCPLASGTVAPVSSVNAELTFANGLPTGGFLNIASFPPTISPFFVDIDLTNGTFLAHVSMAGSASGPIAYVPLTSAAWLFGSAIFGLMGLTSLKHNQCGAQRNL